jgi:hypothetical protein
MIKKGNLPSMRLVEGEGFKLHRTLLMLVIAVRKEMDVPSEGKISDPLPGIALPVHKTHFFLKRLGVTRAPRAQTTLHSSDLFGAALFRAS